MANNIHKKLTFEDKFARHFYCDHARLNQLRQEKKAQRKSMRKINKEIIRKSLDNLDDQVYNKYVR